MKPTFDSAPLLVDGIGARRGFQRLPLQRIVRLLITCILVVLGSQAAAETSETAPESGWPQVALSQEFEQKVWPLLTRGEDGSCVSCHDAETSSDLHFFSDPGSSFQHLIEQGYFSNSDPDGLLGRLTSANPKKRMPKGKAAQPWSEGEIEELRKFIAELDNQLERSGPADEQFPSALGRPYTGPEVTVPDTQFISFRQLKGKIQSIFKDDWVRNGHDRFQENIAMFGGADFKDRFNETTKASPTFLAALDAMTRDVAARAYAQRTGPFEGLPEALASPLELASPDPDTEQALVRLYQKILFRSPTRQEIEQSFALLQSVYRSKDQFESREYELSFHLTAEDPKTGLTSSESVVIPVRADPGGLYQEVIDQSQVGPEEAEPAESDKPVRRRDRRVSGKLARLTLNQAFRLRPNDAEQLLTISNSKTIGNVSFHSVELQPVASADTNLVQIIAATNTAVHAEGAWKIETRRGLTTLEDENNDKGNSSISVQLDVATESEYHVTLCWRQNSENARAVMVEVVSQNPSVLRAFAPPPKAPAGEAHYFIDQSNDSIAFADLNASFRFGTNDYVEINNRGTRNRVTADAVKFIPGSGKTLLIDNDEAEGKENWKEYDSGEFRAYNQTGKNSYHDENARKGELFLRYLPSLRKEQWKPGEFYHVAVGYPAKRDHEIHAPVVVRAQESSPILVLTHPMRAQVGATLTLDASSSYTVQGSALQFRWQQTGGPAVAIADLSAPTLNFKVPTMGAQQAAWEALCRALVQHPDFLFTRPPSTSTATAAERNRLLLVKISQDLLARPPSPAELQKLAGGQPLTQFVDEYVRSEEFKDFYFHRIRLYLESQGSEIQDEPARLWCYIAFHDRPFQEILTADYTVDTSWQKQRRPIWCGRTGVLTTRGFIDGKPGLPHFNYAAQVAELFLGYVFEVPPEVVEQREGITAASTTDPASLCYSCHKILTPLAFQRTRWDDLGRYRVHDEYGLPIDDSDQGLVASYPFQGNGLEAFALQAVKKERFIRTILNTHFTFYFGRGMRYLEDERVLYKRLWDQVHRDQFTIRGLIQSMLTSPEYLGAPARKEEQTIVEPQGRTAPAEHHASGSLLPGANLSQTIQAQ